MGKESKPATKPEGQFQQFVRAHFGGKVSAVVSAAMALGFVLMSVEGCVSTFGPKSIAESDAFPVSQHLPIWTGWAWFFVICLVILILAQMDNYRRQLERADDRVALAESGVREAALEAKAQVARIENQAERGHMADLLQARVAELAQALEEAEGALARERTPGDDELLRVAKAQMYKAIDDLREALPNDGDDDHSHVLRAMRSAISTGKNTLNAESIDIWHRLLRYSGDLSIEDLYEFVESLTLDMVARRPRRLIS
jgi:hypothetical protein